MGQLACRRFANRDQLFQGMAFVCCQRYPILCHGRIPFLGPFHTLRPYESESYVTRQSKIDEALASTRLTAKGALEGLRAHGYRDDQLPAPSTMAAVLNRMGFRLRKVVKAKPQKTIKETDAIFANIKKRMPMLRQREGANA